jgi:hypothetical protein
MSDYQTGDKVKVYASDAAAAAAAGGQDATIVQQVNRIDAEEYVVNFSGKPSMPDSLVMVECLRLVERGHGSAETAQAETPAEETAEADAVPETPAELARDAATGRFTSSVAVVETPIEAPAEEAVEAPAAEPPTETAETAEATPEPAQSDTEAVTEAPTATETTAEE